MAIQNNFTQESYHDNLSDCLKKAKMIREEALQKVSQALYKNDVLSGIEAKNASCALTSTIDELREANIEVFRIQRDITWEGN